MPPPAPRSCLGRDELIEEIVGLAENLEPIALIGAGGIGKTSIALTVLHHDRIKARFGDDRRFIRCDQFPPTRTHFLARLSKVIGAGIENPEDLAPLRPRLSSRELLLIIDNGESIIDPHGQNTREILAVVDELCQFKTICICITSRITTVPRCCKRPQILTLSMEAARDIFYSIYGGSERPEIIDNLLQRLDFHALSITLLATTASYNTWDHDRLVEEWEAHHAQVLETDHNESLAATIELSLASPTFRKLGSHARDLLGVAAFLPQGVNEKNVNWLFSTIPEGRNIFDKFCALSLTYRNNGFTTMLAPIRDHLRPRDPKLSPLLCAARDRYFSRLSGFLDPTTEPRFGEAQWITSEDVNVEHLLYVFTSIDANSNDVWDACVYFMNHLCWHKPRRTILAKKIEALPDDHRSKPSCLLHLSRLFKRLGNYTEERQLLIHTLELKRRRGDDHWVATTLGALCEVNWKLRLHEEGIQQAREAAEIYERLGDTIQQANCLSTLVRLLLDDKQLDAAEATASRLLVLIPEKGQELLVCKSHRTLGLIAESKGENEKAIHHFKTALGIALPFDWHGILFWSHYDLACLFRDEGGFDNANAHLEQARLYTVDNMYYLGCATEMQARVWRQQHRVEEAKSEALRALEIYEKLGNTKDVGRCEKLLQGWNK